ncbi:tetratricopeptide repeat protein [Sphingomonas sp. M1-B02]|uniref:tetratricopeptide repeat protein n=1 Tax=Sphingomonas sp. M1-B02 TaxID=3114300 RepID=UPI00223F44AD|nr:tetratricopeptide repeat protein [Sphingomonas sp. S6-11]UZK65848.1 tetratricopeptide repeat protein [Sphingomonas sp. S6-11]
MFFSLLLILQAAPAPASPPPGQEPPRFAECMDLATGDPGAGQANASRWSMEGGGMLARQCLGVAYANQRRWDSAAAAFEEAAREGELNRDRRAANYWAQAGNAWLAAGNAAKARAALDAALAAGTLEGLALGEVHLDRARAMVAANDLDAARADLDRATQSAPADPLTWLLSATLARRQNDAALARKHIDEALRRSPDDASVQLEAGNIAAAAADEAGARTAWNRAIELAPGSPTAESARKALAQFGATEK